MATLPEISALLPQGTMLIIHSKWNDKPSFRLIPIDPAAPFVECVFDPENNIMGIVGLHVKRTLQLVTRLDENGDRVVRKNLKGSAENPASQNPVQMQRIETESYYDYWLEDKRDILALVELVARNAQHEGFREFFPSTTN